MVNANGAVSIAPPLIDAQEYDAMVTDGVNAVQAISENQFRLTRLCGLVEYKTRSACRKLALSEVETAKRVYKTLATYANDIKYDYRRCLEHAQLFRFYGIITISAIEDTNLFFSHARAVMRWFNRYDILTDDEKRSLACDVLDYVSDEDWRVSKLEVEIKKLCGQYVPPEVDIDVEIDGAHVRSLLEQLDLTQRYRVRITKL